MTTLLLAISLLSAPNSFPAVESLANWKFAKKVLILSADHRAALAKNGFFVSPDTNALQLSEAYGENDYANLSSLITVDTVVDIYHVFFDSSLRSVEEQHLDPDLKTLTSLTLKHISAQTTNYLKEEQADVAAYVGVADRLLGLKDPIPVAAQSKVNQELDLILKHAGFATSPIFGFDLDYSQFIVRGHYGKSPQLGNYFKAMMWFGLPPFALEDKAGNPLPKSIREAGLLVDALNASGAMPYWKRIYGSSSLFVGASNALTPTAWTSITAPIIGSPLNKEKLSAADSPARILSAIKEQYQPAVTSNRTRGTNPGNVQLKLMGQRAIPDSVAISKLTGDERPMPSSLDVGSIFGSQSADRILDASPATYNPLNWSGYEATRRSLQSQWSQEPASYWDQNLYNGFLDVLRKVVEKPDPKAAPVMQTSQWADMRLSSALAGWAFLRHDTILYGEQTVAEMGDGGEIPPFVKGYVEPNLAVYQRLLSLLQKTNSSLQAFNYFNSVGKSLSGGIVKESDEFSAYESLLKFFITISTKELSGKNLTKDEHEKIRHIEGDLAELITDMQLVGTKYNVLSQDDLDMAQIADVHTAGDKALEVAVGHPDQLIAIIPIEGKNYLARGSVMSFYEFTVPISERMTDHQWKALMTSKKLPSRPPWINSYFINKSVFKAD